jgi:PAS domain S-box-containing protein
MQRDYPMKVDRGAGIEQAYFTFSYAPLRGDGGLIEGIYCTVHETTPGVIAAQQRDSAETELRELNHFLERSLLERTHERNQLWEVSRDLFLIADLDGRALNVNPAWERVLGYPQGEFLGRTTEWLEHSDDQFKTRQEIHRLFLGDATLSFENRFRARDGKYRFLNWTAIRDGDLLYCSARDVTQERANEMVLRDTEDFARLALSAVGGLGVWKYDMSRDRFIFDAAIAALYDLDSHQPASGISRTEFLANVHPGDRHDLEQAMDKRSVFSGDFEIEYRRIHADGSIRWILERGQVSLGEKGRSVRCVGIAIDVTSQRKTDAVIAHSRIPRPAR